MAHRVHRGKVLRRVGDRVVRLPPRVDEWIYFILCPVAGLIKIGYTSNILTRAANYTTESPVRLKLLGAIHGGTREAERGWHDRFREDCHHGEWFRVSRDLLVAIATAHGFCEDPIATLRQMDESAVASAPELWAKWVAERSATKIDGNERN